MRIAEIACSMLAFSCAYSASALAADDYQDARAEMVAAWQAQDFAAMQVAAREALSYRPDSSGARFNLALANALNGDDDSALMELHRVADQAVYFPVETMEQFAGLHDEFTWPDLLFKYERLLRPKGTATRAASFGASDFIPEGILRLGKGHFILGSIRTGSLLEYRDDELREISSPASGGHWSVFGIREDAEGMLWFASSAVEQFAGVTEETLGRAGLFRIDPATGKVLDELLLPDDGKKHVLGDLVIAEDGSIYTTDSLTGSIYRYDPTLRQLDEIVTAGTLRSPQGLLLVDNDSQLLVAEYGQGLFVVDTASGEMEPIQNDSGTSLLGIDGLYRHGDSLIVTQNGIQPHRIARLELDIENQRITRGTILLANHPEFREPTLGQVSGDRFWVVANSQWNRFDAEGNLDETDLVKPVILELSLKD